MSPFLLNFYREAYSAITDFPFYRMIFEQPLRKTLGYLLSLSLHAAALLTLIFAWQYGPKFLDICRWAQQNFPLLVVEDGLLNLEVEQPLVKKYPGEDLITFVFDTTGRYQDPRELEEPAFLFTRENLYFRIVGQTQTYSWKDFGPLRVGPAEIAQLRDMIRWVYFPAGFLMFLTRTLVAKTLLCVLLTVVGLSASMRYQIRLTFQQYFTIALYSLTPAVVIDLAVTMTGLDHFFFSVIYVATAAIYTYMATQRCVVLE